MIWASLSIRSDDAIKKSNLNTEQKVAAWTVCSGLHSYAWAIQRVSVSDDGNFKIEVQVDKTSLPKGDSTPYTATSVSTYLRDSFYNAGLNNIDHAVNTDTGYATVVIIPNTDDSNAAAEEARKQGIPKEPNPTSTSSANETKQPTLPVELSDVQSSDAKATVSTAVPNTSEFYLDVQVFLEGVQVPHNTCAVSYGINSPPSCTIIVPASSMIRDLPETTKIHVFFKDLLPTADGVYEWRLLFDGELASLEYTADSNGASMSISGMHSSAYMTLMQILTLDVAQYVFAPNPQLIGNATVAMVLGQNKVNNSIIRNILNSKGYKTMADIVYQLLRSILRDTNDSAVGKFYMTKLGNGLQGWKILKRIYGISKLAASTPEATVSPSTTNSTTAGNPNSGTGDMSGSSSDIVSSAMSYVSNTGRDTTVDGIYPFECDGLVTASLRKAGREPDGWPTQYAPAQQQFAMAHGMYSTDSNAVQPGDIIYLNLDSDNEPGHTGIFSRDSSGKGWLIHNSSSAMETVTQSWEPPGFDGLSYLGHARV